MVSELYHMCISTLTSNIIAWLWKALETDKRLSMKLTTQYSLPSSSRRLNRFFKLLLTYITI